MSTPTLLSPITVGEHILDHRIVLAPLTRLRNTDQGVPQAHCVEYYQQRTTKNGLLIAEGTKISSVGGAGYTNAPGIYTDKQVKGWRKVVDAVHAKGGIIFNQLWHVGRTGDKNTVSASAIPLRVKDVWGNDPDIPHELTYAEIKSTIRDFANSAKNAIIAGFDGVEIHGANGYLIDQFTNSSSNFRTDRYGGSIENRARFALEVVDAVVDAVGEKKVAIRFSPWSEFQDMKDDTPLETWTYITKKLQKQHPKLAYIHFCEARQVGLSDVDTEEPESLDPFREIWKGPFISCGGYNREKAIQLCEDKSNSLVAFGRIFIANPDLVERFRRDLPLNKYNRPTFYSPGTEGYIDYPFYSGEENTAE